MKIYINGEYYDRDSAMVSVFDHGLLYGDGVFEGIRAYNGKVFRLKDHIERLFASAKSIMLDIGMTETGMCQAVEETVKYNNKPDCYIRLLLTRGEGPLGLDPFQCPKPNVIIIVGDIALYPAEYYKTGIEIITSATRRTSPSILDGRIKSLNYLNNIMAKAEAKQAGALEAVMLNDEGYVVECTGDNIFIVKSGVLCTPAPYLGALDGITRKTVLEIAVKSGIKTAESVFTRYDLYTADECFLTGTGAEIIPVIKIDGRVIGNGKPGEMTGVLAEKFRVLAG